MKYKERSITIKFISNKKMQINRLAEFFARRYSKRDALKQYQDKS